MLEKRSYILALFACRLGSDPTADPAFLFSLLPRCTALATQQLDLDAKTPEVFDKYYFQASALVLAIPLHGADKVEDIAHEKQTMSSEKTKTVTENGACHGFR
jgi:hypothetical protein